MPVQRGQQFSFGWYFGPFQERSYGDHHAVDAVAALRRLLVKKGLLYRMRVLRCAESFHRGDVAVLHRPHRSIAALHGMVTEHDGAAAALTGPAAKTRSF